MIIITTAGKYKRSALRAKAATNTLFVSEYSQVVEFFFSAFFLLHLIIIIIIKTTIQLLIQYDTFQLKTNNVTGSNSTSLGCHRLTTTRHITIAMLSTGDASSNVNINVCYTHFLFFFADIYTPSNAS